MAKKRAAPPLRRMLLFDGLRDDVEGLRLSSGFMLTQNGLIHLGTVPDQLNKWEEVLSQIRIAEKGNAFAVGDFAEELESKFGENAAQVLDASCGWSLSTLQNYRWVARNIAPEFRRMDRLTFKHHQLVAKATLTDAQRSKWLSKAAADDEDEPWTVRQLRDALKDSGELETVFWVVVKCTNGQVQSDLVERLEREGLECVARQAKRAAKKKKKEEAA